MELKEYNEISEALDKAEDDNAPFAVIANDEINVVGDANKTELNKHDYMITFRLPQKQEDGSYKYAWQTKEYKDVFITPRNDAKVVRLITALLPYFRKMKEDKKEKFTEEEAVKIVTNFDDELMDLMIQTVSAVLKIPAELAEYITRDSLLGAATQIILDYPETVNEADTFFK